LREMPFSFSQKGSEVIFDDTLKNL